LTPTPLSGGIAVKLSKLKFTLPLRDLIDSQINTNQISILPIALEHVFTLEKLPDHHRDPFDRLLIATAIAEGAILISHDPLVQQYPVDILW
jgi:PIN domain nuclease of toxin-antitoxin system